MQWVFAAFVDVTVNFLESSFKQNPRVSSSPEDFFSTDNNGPEQQQDDKEQKIKAAYTFMELEPPVSQEELKKNYKKLSLRYHPDRNGGSKESHEKMQILNACMDLVEKDIYGVTDDSDDMEKEDNVGSEKEQEEDPRERYMRMRREMQEEMEKEMKRQHEMREHFEANKVQQKKECESESRKLQLDTPEGRENANKKFTNEVMQQKKIRDENSSSTKENQESAESSASNHMDGIDENDHIAETAKKEIPGNKRELSDSKPRNEIMDCNADDLVVALRLGMPDIAISLLQNRLKTYFQEAARNMHFEGVKKKQEEVRLDFLLEPLDLDGNSILHYACYYESYQAIKIICQVALKDRQIDPVISQENYHSQTPLFYAEIAKDESILPLVQSQIHTAKMMKERTQFVPALKAGGRRIVELFQHFGVSPSLSTALAFYIAHVIFDLHALSSLGGLIVMQFSGPQRAKSNPDVTSIIVLLVFCALWKFSAFVITFVFQFIMVELALILAPIILAGIVSSSRKRMLLFPFIAHNSICQRIIPVWIQIHKRTTPNVVTKHGWARPYFLGLTILVVHALKQLV